MNNYLLFSRRFGYPLQVLALQSALALPLAAVASARPALRTPGAAPLDARAERAVLPPLRPDARAADVPVSGRVTQGKGEGLPGVTVIVKGTTQGTTTDGDGNFSLTVPEGSVLQFSSIGFNAQEVTVREATTALAITLQENSQSLDNVVVVGYGSLDKREVTSTITHIDSRELLTVGAINPITALQGKVAGLTIANGSAADPNSQPSIQLRGVSSRSAGLGPLVVINGVPGGNLENINQNDIESIDVLKGGAASAIYGTRGSNGVLVVTTKKGTKDNHLDYNTYATFDYATLQPKVLSAEDFLANKRGTDFGAQTNWLKEISRNYAFAQKHSLTA